MNDIKTYKNAAISQYQLRTKKIDGEDHLVVPVVMMVEGVHNGSQGSIYHSIDELSKYLPAWDGIPVVINHPTNPDGQFISANCEDNMEKIVGRVYGTHVDGSKLKAKVYLSIKKTEATSPLTIAYIRQGKPLEVSVGVFSDSQSIEGEWNGEKYIAVAKNYRPDHLALLPEEKGACSWEDGCGIRVNQEVVIKPETLTNTGYGMTIEEIRKIEQQGMRLEIMANAQSLNKRLSAVASALHVGETKDLYRSTEEVYEDKVIYVEYVEGKGETLYQQTYQMKDDGTVELTGDRVKVKKEISYLLTNKQKEEVMTDEKSPCCLAKVDKLIANKATNFTEADRSWLMEQDEAIIEKLMPQEIPAMQVNQEMVKAYMEGKPIEEAIKMFPEKLTELVNNAITEQQVKKTNLIQTIQTNAKGIWSEDELKSMEIPMLEKLVKTTSQVVDYSANGGRNNAPVNTLEEYVIPAGI